jgi:hypothetical protein
MTKSYAAGVVDILIRTTTRRGTWDQAPPQTFKLNHRVWLYTPDGTFLGVGHLHETLTLADRGNTQSGSFTLDLYDLSGNKLAELATGTVTGERISVNEF